MKVKEIRCTPFSIPFHHPLALPDKTIPARRGLLVEVETVGGEIGIGEASPHPAAAPAVLTAAETTLRAVAPTLVAAEMSVSADVFERSVCVEDPVARVGLEAALCDATARCHGTSLAEFLGVTGPAQIPVNATIVTGDPRQAAVEAERAVAAGFSCLKLKVGARDESQAVAKIRAVRQAVGPDIQIRLDANAAWSVDEAIRVLANLTDWDVEYVEQPVADLDGMAAVRRATGVSLAADEIVHDAASVHRIAAAGAADVVVVKPSLLGLCTSLSVVAAAAAHGLGVVVTSLLDTSIGIAAALPVAASVRPPRRAAGLATVSLLQGDLVAEPLLPRRGEMLLPTGPGLGVDLDAKSLRRWRTAKRKSQ